MKTGTFSILLIIAVPILALQKVRYDYHKVFRLHIANEEQLDALKDIEEYSGGYNFWGGAKSVGKTLDVMVPPHLFLQFKSALENATIKHEVLVEDVQRLIEEETENQKKTLVDGTFKWTRYYNLRDIYDWIKGLENKYPGKVTVINIGSTYEGRDLLVVKISFSPNNKKRSVFIEGGIHAREWISPATVTYFINELLTSKDRRLRTIADAHDWYLMPVLNADGYDYSHNRDRMWRKTRKPYGRYYGADANRNWDFHWMESGGASSQPQSEAYAGPQPFSENCTRALSNFISSIGPNLKAYIAFHSYSQLLMTPYGHTQFYLDNYHELVKVGRKAAQSLSQRFGTRYKVGNIPETVGYYASGGSMDWVKGRFRTRVTYTYELRDTGRHGFILPPDQIIPNCLEIVDSLITIFEEFK